MALSRREFLQLIQAGAALGLLAPGKGYSTRHLESNHRQFYEIPPFGNLSLMHFTDAHAQLLPVYYREPHINLGVHQQFNHPPHLTGQALLAHYGIPASSAEAYAMTHLDFVAAAREFGQVGGFSHLATLIKSLRSTRPHSLLLDGGDTWQGSATSLWTQGQDMIDAQLLLGVDVMTMHWEMTYGEQRVRQVLENDFQGKIDFVAQNITDTEWEEPVFPAYTLREVNGVPVAIIGQSFPYTPIANPGHLIPNWSFGIQEERLQQIIDEVREAGARFVALLSHNGMDVDLKLASRVNGLDAIFGGHTHDAVPAPVTVTNAGGSTLVINSGSNGKFLSLLDLEIENGQLKDYRYRLIPIFSSLLEPDPAMQQHIDTVRAPYLQQLNEELALTESLLYRRGNFNGTFDQVIVDALRQQLDAEIAFSPGFRWGTSLLPQQIIRFEDVMAQTAITYPATTRNELTGQQIHAIMEDVADNLFNADPYKQQGGDMVRTGGLSYQFDPSASIGQRISQLQANGKPISPNKKYIVAGWASVQPDIDGEPVWDVVSNYLRDLKTVNITAQTPNLVNMTGNKGYSQN